MDSTRRQELVKALLAYGLNEYEARAYLALLEAGSAPAGEIARRSGIPRPRVYDTLQRLIDASLVSDQGGNPRRYSPLPLDDFLEQMTAHFRRRQEMLRRELAAVRAERNCDGIFHVHDEAPLRRLAEDLVDAARNDLVVHLSASEWHALIPTLERALARGVRVRGEVLGTVEVPAGAEVRVSSGQGRETGPERRLVICRDNEEILAGRLGGVERPYGMRTRNWLLVEILQENASTPEGAWSEGAATGFVSAGRS